MQIFHRGPGSHFSRALCLRFSIYLWQHARFFFWPANNYFYPKRGNHVVDSKENQMFLFLR